MFYKPPVETMPIEAAKAIKKAKELTMAYNFDRPEAIDWEMLEKALDALTQHKRYMAPCFDEKLKTRYIIHVMILL